MSRNCGSCTVCCVTHEVTEKTDVCGELRVVTKAGERCQHAVCGGCGIYADRPRGCKEYQCYWLTGGLKEECRPDKSGVLVDRDYSWSPFVTTYLLLVEEALIVGSTFKFLRSAVLDEANQRTIDRSLVVVICQTKVKGKKIHEVIFLPERNFTIEEKINAYTHYARLFQNNFSTGDL